MEALEPFVGEWAIESPFAEGPSGRLTFEWMDGGRFLVERWEAPDPMPDGIAIFGPDPDSEGFLQHYFDTRGVARVYQMSFADGVWKLWRDEADFSPLDFAQRYTGTFDAEGRTIAGRWEICHDGSTWETDFELNYRRVG